MTTGTTTPITLGLRRFWRIPVAAVLGAILGFGGSFFFGVAYAAKTRVLLHVNNLTLLQTNGSTLTNQGAQSEQATIGQAMAATQGALLGNNVIATKIVKKLHLDKKENTGGVFNAAKGALSTTIKFTESYLLHGTYKKLSRFDQAVQDTQKGLSAKEVGFSWALEVTGRWKTPEKATAIANLAADYLVQAGEKRFQDEVTANTKNLQEQVRLAGEREQKAAADFAAFAVANGIDTSKLGVALTPDIAQKLAPAAQTQFQSLQSEFNTSLAAFTQFQVQYQQAQVYAGVKPVEMTRIDKAVAGVYPVSPKRWLYMAIGIVLGSLVGLGLTARWFWRRGETMFPRDDDYPPRDDDDDEGAAQVPPASTAESNEPRELPEPAETSTASNEPIETAEPAESSITLDKPSPSEQAVTAEHKEQYGHVKPETTPTGGGRL